MFSASTSSLLATTLFFINALTPVLAKGINCDGAAGCQFNGIGHSNIPKWFYDRFAGSGDFLGKGVGDSIQYPPGYQIACAGEFANTALCLYTQGTAASYKASDLKLSLMDLVNLGCKGCGSAPLNRVGNSFNDGMLTINVVKNPSCEGICSLPNQARSEEWAA